MTAAHRVIEARKALQVKLERDVRFGSKADMCVAKRDVRFTPESDIKCDIKECPLWAKSGHIAAIPSTRSVDRALHPLVPSDGGPNVLGN
jgi:hypothetical protein